MLLWKERTGQPYKGYSATKWWSKYEVIKQLMDLFCDVRPFLKNATVSPSTRERILSAIDNTQKREHLMVELAETIDEGMPFVRATYGLKGDGPLSLTCYKTITALNFSARQAY